MDSLETNGGRLLLIDDEVQVAEAMSRLLRQDHEVLTVGSGIAAKELLGADQGFDVIICDLMMPSISGMDLHGWLTAEHPELAARMLFITGGAFTSRARDFLQRIDNPRLEKPVEPAQLRAELRALTGSYPVVRARIIEEY